MATHEDWQAAIDRRDRCARLTVQAVLDGRPDLAMTHAMESSAADDDAHRIGVELA